MSGKKKGLLIGGIAGGVALIGAVVAIVLLLTNKTETYRVIKVMSADGHSYVARGDIKDLEAYEGMALQSGDSVHVDGNSSLILMLDEDKLVYVEQNTDFSIVAEGTAKDSRSRIELTKGALTCEIQNDLSSGSTYEINTPNSTMAVRGTSFRVEVTDVETIRKVIENNAIQPSMLFMSKTLEGAGVQGLNSITRLTITDGKVSLTCHNEKGEVIGSEVLIDENSDILIGGNDKQSSIIEQITGIDPSTFPAITIEIFGDIASGSGKMVISFDDLKAQKEENDQMPHMITFMYGTTVFGTQTVEYGSLPKEPELMPTPKGKWYVDFSLPLKTDTIVYWIPEN